MAKATEAKRGLGMLLHRTRSGKGPQSRDLKAQKEGHGNLEREPHAEEADGRAWMRKGARCMCEQKQSSMGWTGQGVRGPGRVVWVGGKEQSLWGTVDPINFSLSYTFRRQ